MQGAARVLIVGNSNADEESFSETIKSNGFEAITGNISQSAAELTGNRRPDVVILNLNSHEGQKNPQAFFQFARMLKQSDLSSRMRIMLIGAEDDIGDTPVPSDIDDLLLGTAKPAQICHRLRSLVRLNTMHEELVRRLNTSAKYGVDAPPNVMPPRTVENVQILYYGETMGFTSIEDALSKHATIVGALSSGTAIDYLARVPFDSVLVDAGDDPSAYLEFASNLRRNSKFFNLPILMLCSAEKLKSLDEAYDAGVTDVLLKPASQEEIRVRTLALIREHRFRNSLRHIYAAAKHYATNDALTGLYARGFLFEHLTNVISDTKDTSQTFSIAAFDIATLAEINQQLGHASGDRLIRQVGELIGLLVRGEDLAARYSGKKFVVILPDTPAEQADNAVQRIRGVIHHTEFVIPDHMSPVHVDLRTNVAGYCEGDTAESLIDRVWDF